MTELLVALTGVVVSIFGFVKRRPDIQRAAQWIGVLALFLIFIKLALHG